jgi:hypothetical protein
VLKPKFTTFISRTNHSRAVGKHLKKNYMKLFNIIIFYCLITCLITLLSTILNNEFNYISIGLSVLGIIVSLTSKYYKKENLLSLILIWYLSATFINEGVKFDFILSFSSSTYFSIGKIGLSFRLLYLIPSILIIIYYDRLSLLSKVLIGTVHTESSQIPFGTKIEFELNDFNGKRLKGITNLKLEEGNFDKIYFEKTIESNKSLASIDVLNDNKKLNATLKMN